MGIDRGFTMAREDGAMLGPYNPMLHFPQFGRAVWGVNAALTENTTLPKPIHELVILVTGARLSARYELYAHESPRQGLDSAKPRSQLWPLGRVRVTSHKRRVLPST